jgi:Mn2+/Fe2+ NRAMP family transporter
MTSTELILVSITSALVAVFSMLVVATIRRARMRDDDVDEKSED